MACPTEPNFSAGAGSLAAGLALDAEGVGDPNQGGHEALDVGLGVSGRAGNA
jgi:hypothetical protein